MTTVTLTHSAPPGRVDVTARALERAVTAIAASELDVPVSDVSVTLTDERGRLGVAVVAPIRVAPLSELAASGMRLIDRAQESRAGIRTRSEQLTGREIGEVSIRLSKAIVSTPRRVR